MRFGEESESCSLPIPPISPSQEYTGPVLRPPPLPPFFFIQSLLQIYILFCTQRTRLGPLSVLLRSKTQEIEAKNTQCQLSWPGGQPASGWATASLIITTLNVTVSILVPYSCSLPLSSSRLFVRWLLQIPHRGSNHPSRQSCQHHMGYILHVLKSRRHVSLRTHR